MNIGQLRNFVAVVDHKSFSKAAEFVNLSQPALSLSINNLEKEVDAKLLVRKRNDVTLTDVGAAFIIHARASLREIEKAQEIISANRLENDQIVKVGLSQLFSNFIARDVLSQFYKEHPNTRTEIEVSAYDTKTTNDGILSGNWDFGVFLSPATQPSLPEDIVIEQCLAINTRIHARKDHPLACQPHVSLKDLNDYDWAISTLTRGNGIITKFANEGLKRPNIIARVNSFNLILELLRSSDTITLMPVEVVNKYYKGQFVQLNNTDFDFPASVNIFYSKDLAMTAPARRLKNMIGDYLKTLGTK